MVRKLGLLFAASLGAFILTGLLSVVTANKHAHDLFRMPVYMGAAPDHIHSVLREQMAVRQSSRDDVEETLLLWGFTPNGQDRCAAPNSFELTCETGDICPAWRLVSEGFEVNFQFEANGARLRSIAVRSGFVNCLRSPGRLVSNPKARLRIIRRTLAKF